MLPDKIGLVDVIDKKGVVAAVHELCRETQESAKNACHTHPGTLLQSHDL